jgi:hypothetical protein
VLPLPRRDRERPRRGGESVLVWQVEERADQGQDQGGNDDGAAVHGYLMSVGPTIDDGRVSHTPYCARTFSGAAGAPARTGTAARRMVR